jgi:hypothetical protein
MENQYAIIDEKGGWIVNMVIWDGDIQKWSPPKGTYAVEISKVDFSSIKEEGILI